ncbi:signal recognition particle-docking protein FtsY [Haploplasma modicum]|uniref:signal recognition particle-docking protein FtsY n=1 Tax=Haploplasma modicum TaxID=2150 RepID=UPI00214C7D04|nr:signal recognition particle-docking protein FtsY [Haploplasma modicum]MCR1808727.1 signal recognition particle-docking protein FtsY [Haploplasma modicum]
MSFFKKLFGRKPKNDKYEMGLHKTKERLGNLKQVLANSKKIDDTLFDELEDIFIQADMGVDTVLYFINELRKEVDNEKIEDPNLLAEIIVDKMFEIYLKGEILDTELDYSDSRINVYLFVGVNGVGKTTTIGKIAKSYVDQGKKVMVVAGDTFRAGAINQLDVWANRSGATLFKKEEGSDPSSVIHDALVLAKKDKYDVVLVDTAGRLQTKVNLMNELAKMKRVIEKNIPGAPHETLLVIDATTGQNGMRQAEVFKEATSVSGIILTKLDGTAKGGIVLAIRHNYGIPIKYVGLGEKIDDLVMFDIESYIYGLFKEFF